MRKLIMLIAIMLLATTVSAGTLNLPDVLKTLPSMKQGVAYSIPDKEYKYMTTAPLVKWKAFSLNAGYSADDKVIVSSSVDLIRLEDFVDIPILDLIEFSPSIYYGIPKLFDGGKCDSDWGVGISILSVKF